MPETDYELGNLPDEEYRGPATLRFSNADGGSETDGRGNADGGSETDGDSNAAGGGNAAGGSESGGGSSGEPFPIEVQVRLSARFEPVEGRFRWAGRTTADPSLRDRVGAGLREAVIVISDSPATPVRLGEPDPWGGVRLSGTGTPPWFRA